MRRLSLRSCLLGSLALHAVAGAGFARWAISFRPPIPEDDAVFLDPVAVTLTPAPAPTPVEATLLRGLPGEPKPPVVGVADAPVPDPSSPWPRADVDTSDPIAASRGGGAEGGTSTWTDRHDDETLRALGWNDPDDYRLPRHRSGDERTSGDSIARLPDPGLQGSQRPAARRARLGAPGSDGKLPPAGEGTGGFGDAADSDPRWDEGGAAAGTGHPQGPGPEPSATEPRTRLREDGAIVASHARPYLPVGARATEADTRGAPADDVNASQASDERRPEALELTQPRAGGDATGEGVRGPDAGDGLSRRSRTLRPGDGGTPSDVPRRAGGTPSTQARLQDAYFQRLHQRVLDHVRYPRDLALSLEQGEVVVLFTLRGDGSVEDVTISRSSGFREFDDEVRSAFAHAAPFGPVPKSVSQGRPKVRVKVPFVFSNPPIR